MSSLLRAPEARRLLRLARGDRAAARAQLAALSPRAQAALLCQAPPPFRSALFDLVESPEAVVPHLPAAELCFTAREFGLGEVGWLLGCATTEQLTALVDIDAWAGLALDHARLREWLPALASAGDATLLRAAQALDPETLMLHLRTRAQVVMKSGADDWEPPPGGRTLDGVFYLCALAEGDDLADVLTLLRVLFQGEYWSYFRLVQSCLWELEMENEEFALRWRNGRLQDAGFPDPLDAKRVYAHLREPQLAQLPPAPAATNAQPATGRLRPADADEAPPTTDDARATTIDADEARRAASAAQAPTIDSDEASPALADEAPAASPPTTADSSAARAAAADSDEATPAGTEARADAVADGLWLPVLVEDAHPAYALFRALRELAPAEQVRVRAAFLELANRVALADAAPLGELATLHGALEKAARLASRGLSYLARENRLPLPDALRRVTVERAFQVGHNLEKREPRPDTPQTA